MIHLKDYLINEQWRNDLDDGTDLYHIIQKSEYINPLCLDTTIGTSYTKHIMNIYERLGESIFRHELLDSHPDIQFIKILKDEKTGYTPEAPSAQIFFNDKDTKRWIVQKCKFMNYYCSKIKETTGKYTNYSELFVQINPNKPRECSQKIIDESGGLVIHLTSKYGMKRILKDGIVPKMPTKDIRPEQIYFLSPTNECIDCLDDFCIDLTSNRKKLNDNRRKESLTKLENKKLIKWFNKTNYFDSIQYAIIFNIKDLKKYRKINFYEDSTTPGFPAYWTAEYIPPSCIIGTQKIEIMK